MCTWTRTWICIFYVHMDIFIGTHMGMHMDMPMGMHMGPWDFDVSLLGQRKAPTCARGKDCGVLLVDLAVPG